ncbi:MAG TPA: serine hydrolase domain-containing protein [Gaiellaceae bacterium]|nr:serine hydrolase domain-containing protein [Gaiellaceae bacterium]
MLDSSYLQASEAAALAWGVPALAFGVSVGGTVETASVGCDPSTRFRVASITKPVTAALAVELLDLEASTGIWPADVRVRHLLSHTSGFDCELTGIDQVRFDSADDPLEAQLPALESVRRWVGVEQCWSYGNAGYWLAGALAGRAAASSYEDAVASRILRPLGLESSSFGEPEVPGTGADAAEGGYPRARTPSGGLVSNVPDLLRFGQHLLAEPRLRILHGKPVGGVYGLGLYGERVGGVEVWGHPGSWGGYQSALLFVPERDAVFVGLTNGSLGRKAVYELADEFFQRLLGARRSVPETVDLPDDARQAFSGSYANSDDSYEVSFASDGLSVKLEDGEFAARPIGERTFEITEGDHVRERFDFPLDGFGRFSSRLAERVS